MIHFCILGGPFETRLGFSYSTLGDGPGDVIGGVQLSGFYSNKQINKQKDGKSDNLMNLPKLTAQKLKGSCFDSLLCEIVELS